MKKLLIMLLVWTVILPLSASAQQQYCSIEEMIRNTPDRWTGTYETSRGTVSVDVPVELPAVNVFPVIKAGKMPAVEAEKLKDYGYVRRNIAGKPDGRPEKVYMGNRHTAKGCACLSEQRNACGTGRKCFPDI